MNPSTNNDEYNAQNLGERFDIKARLGHGGSGDVYEAFDKVLERTVAVKVLRPGNPDPQAGDRLLREARACARLSHTGIVTIHEVVEAGDGIGIVMERLPGTSLDAATGDDWDRTVSGRIGIVIQILLALGYAHRQGVVHRDMKPRNVQRLPEGSIKLLDFGVAHITGVDTLTVTGTITGTVHYASPEQLRGEATDARTDIYSTGILTYELLTGRRPFNGDTIGAVITKVLHEPLPRMDGKWTTEIPEIEQIIRKATAKDREERYSGAEEMRDALRAALASMDSPTEHQDLGPLSMERQSYSSQSEGRREAEGSNGTTAATSTNSSGEQGVANQSESPTRRWRMFATAGATAAALAVVGLLWPYGSRTPWPTEPESTASASQGSDHYLPTVEAATEAGEEPRAGEEGEEELATAPQVAELEEARPASTTSSITAPAPADGRPATKPSPTAKGLYYQSSDAPNGGIAGSADPNAGIRYRVLRRQPGGGAAEVDAETTFRSGDRIRFAFEPNVDGFLYVVQRGSSGRWSVLLPHPEINEGRNAVTAFAEVTIPPEGWFRMDETPGREQVFVYLSRKPIEALPGGTEAVVTAHSTDEHTVSVLSGQVRSRDLVFEKEAAPDGSDQAAYVVNHANAGGAVAWTVELKHR